MGISTSNAQRVRLRTCSAESRLIVSGRDRRPKQRLRFKARSEVKAPRFEGRDSRAAQPVKSRSCNAPRRQTALGSRTIIRQPARLSRRSDDKLPTDDGRVWASPASFSRATLEFVTERQVEVHQGVETLHSIARDLLQPRQPRGPETSQAPQPSHTARKLGQGPAVADFEGGERREQTQTTCELGELLARGHGEDLEPAQASHRRPPQLSQPDAPRELQRLKLLEATQAVRQLQQPLSHRTRAHASASASHASQAPNPARPR
mmetsp:Transcript_75201/g.201581  ORF Transcript_75201/g.201581 Transcript_75201/m.201581 type:complete len:263 (+) Transcript_75201:449-1237(+)